ncbi:MAG: ABC transporter substrate-binding protein [Streptosporangiales bacterium]
MRRHRASIVPLAAVSAATALGLAACGTTTANTSLTANASKPITVGISLPLTGASAADGQATRNGYELWASDVNRNGGLLGRQVKLVIVDDKDNPNVIASQYKTLIQTDHVQLTLAPFSTLLTVPAEGATRSLGYALAGGAATGPLVYQANDPLMFSVSTPDQAEMQPFANWVTSLPGPNRPKTAAYPMVNDPFADPPVQATQTYLQSHGIRTVYSINPNNAPQSTSTGALARMAATVANDHPDAVVLGSVDLPTLLTFVRAFQSANYTPRIFIAASGPDQGQAFLNTLGRNSAEAMMVPDGWYGQEQNALSHVMVQDYIAKFGGTSSDINADVAEAYASGEVLADAVTATHSFKGSVLAQYLHTHTLQTAEGPAFFNSVGENTDAINSAFIFQWQNGHFFQELPNRGPGAPLIEAVKPHW